MSTTPITTKRSRIGGRSARIQASVHKAVEALTEEVGRSELTVPLIAARAGVTPSTIYRRWGGLAELLADVAAQTLRPAADPVDTGSVEGDLLAWAEQYADEMSSEVGRAMIRDVLSGPAEQQFAGQCCGYVVEQLQVIADRAGRRGEPPLDVGQVIDHVVAPIMYRILFSGTAPDAAYCRSLVERMAGPRQGALPLTRAGR